MECRITSANKFKNTEGFKQHDVILTKEQSVLTKIMSSFKRENMQTRYDLSHSIYLCFHDYKLAIENNENEHSVRNIDSK